MAKKVATGSEEDIRSAFDDLPYADLPVDAGARLRRLADSNKDCVAAGFFAFNSRG
jgi:hypothetical protein